MPGTVYNNVGGILLSVDENNEVWVHFGVEFRGGTPLLSTFGGAIDSVDDKSEHPAKALLRELHEEALGTFDSQLSFEQLTNPNQTYSFSYTNPVNHSSTVVFATTIDHPKDMNAFHQQFEKERNDRMYQNNGKKFHSDPETEVKQLRSVKLSELKQYLANLQIDPTATFESSDSASSFLAVDRDSKKYNAQGELTDYKVLEENGEAVKLALPTAIGLRADIAGSLQKVMPMMEHRLFGKPLMAEQDFTEAFFGKSIRADEFSFIEDFVDTLPIKDLVYRKTKEPPKGKNAPPLARTSEFRTGRRQLLTARGTGIYDQKLKKESGIGKQYTEAQKAEYTAFNSLSYFSVNEGTPVFGWSKDRANRLLGIASPDVLPNRLFIYDGGTVSRPYDGISKVELLRYVQNRAYTNHTVFDESDMPAFIQKVKETKDSSYNEVLGRIRWNIEKSSICVFSDNQETRWVAINWANKINQKIHSISEQEFRKGNITEAEFKKLKSYRVPISYYDPANMKNGFYDEALIKSDIEDALRLFDNIDERKKAIADNNFEFLLMLNDENRISQVINDPELMRKLLESRLFIAEDLIDKYKALTGKLCKIEKPFLIQFKNITRSFLEKLLKGDIEGFDRDPQGRIVLSGLKIENKDLSGMDLRQFNFNNCTLSNVVLKNVKLNIQAEDMVKFDDCDLTDTPTHTLDLQNSTISGSFIYNDKDPNIQIYDKMVTSEFVKNHQLKDILSLIERQGDNIPNYLLTLGFLLAGAETNKEAFDILLPKLKPGVKLDIETSTVVLISAAMMGNIEVIQRLLAEEPTLTINTKDKDGFTPMMWATKFGKKDVVAWMLKEFPEIEVDAQNTYGNTALYEAVNNEDEEMIKLLLKHCADVTIENNAQVSNLQMALKKRPAIFKLLLDANPQAVNLPLQSFSDRGHSLLTIAIKENNLAAVNAILEKDISTMDYVIASGRYDNGWTPIFYAISLENNEIAKALIQANPQCLEQVLVNAVYKSGMTALEDAIYRHNTTLVTWIINQYPETLQHRIKGNMTGYDGLTPLGLAIQIGDLDTVKAICDAHPESLKDCMIAGDKWGHTPFTHTTLCNKDIRDYLLAKHPEVLNYPMKGNPLFEGYLPLPYLIATNESSLALQIIQAVPKAVSYVMTDTNGNKHNALTFALDRSRDDIAKAMITSEALQSIFAVPHREINLSICLRAMESDEMGKLLVAQPEVKEYMDRELQQNPQDMLLLAILKNKYDIALKIVSAHPNAIVAPCTLDEYQGVSVYHYLKYQADPKLALDLSMQFESTLQAAGLLVSNEKHYAKLLATITDLIKTDAGKLKAFKLLLSQSSLKELQGKAMPQAIELLSIANTLIETLPLDELGPVFLQTLTTSSSWPTYMLMLRPGLSNVQGSVQCAQGFDALTFAIINNRTEEAMAIIQANPGDLSHVVSAESASKGHNALTLAIEKWDVKLIEEIIKKMSPEALEATEYQGHNALTYLLEQRDRLSYDGQSTSNRLALTIAQKAPNVLNFNIKNDNSQIKGHTPFTLLCFHQLNPELLAALIEQFPESLDYVIKGSAFDDGFSGFIQILKHRKDFVSQALIKRPQALHSVISGSRFEDGHSPLTFLLKGIVDTEILTAIIAADPTVLDFVIDNDKNFDFNGMSPLTVVVKKGKPEYIKTLLAAAPHLVDKLIEQGQYEGFNAFALAIDRLSWSRGFEVLKELMAASPQGIHKPFKEWPLVGLTPFTYALKHLERKMDTIRTLLEAYPQLIKEAMQAEQTDLHPQLALSVLDSNNPISALLLDKEPTLKAFAEEQLKHHAAHLLTYALSVNTVNSKLVAKRIAKEHPEAIQQILFTGPNAFKSAYYMAQTNDDNDMMQYLDEIIASFGKVPLEKKYADINQYIEQLKDNENPHQKLLQILLRQVDYSQLANSTEPQAKRLIAQFEKAMKVLPQNEANELFLFSLQFKMMSEWSGAMLKRSPTIGNASGSNKYLAGLNALMGAITSGNEALALEIIRNNPDSVHFVVSENIQDIGHTPLTLAILHNQPEVVKMIVAVSPQALEHVIKNNNTLAGFTPMKLAELKNKKMVALLKIGEPEKRPDAMRFAQPDAKGTVQQVPLADSVLPDADQTLDKKKKI